MIFHLTNVPVLTVHHYNCVGSKYSQDNCTGCNEETVTGELCIIHVHYNCTGCNEETVTGELCIIHVHYMCTRCNEETVTGELCIIHVYNISQSKTYTSKRIASLIRTQTDGPKRVPITGSTVHHKNACSVTVTVTLMLNIISSHILIVW